MDFLTDLPTVSGKYTVLVVVDRFSKMLRLIPLGEQTDTDSVAGSFFDHMVCIHQLPCTMISDGDLRFVGYIWTGFISTMGIMLLFSTAYHPQTDG